MLDLTYRIVENGYYIDLNGKPWFSQLGEYSKPYDKNKSYEENAEMQIADLQKVEEMANAE